MRRTLILTLFALFFLVGGASAQKAKPVKGGTFVGYEVIDGDTIPKVHIKQLYVYPTPKDMREYQKLIRDIKKVYPLAKEAAQYMNTLEKEFTGLKNQRQKDNFSDKMEKEILKKYTPVIENMTRSQGKLLIKLIDRETQKTGYELIRNYRGRFSAGFWNTLAKLFKLDLKDSYDKNGADKMIEQIIVLYENGQV